MEPFASNRELSEYLSKVATILEQRGAEELSYAIKGYGAGCDDDE